MKRLDNLLKTNARSGWRRIAWVIALLISAVTAWAALTELDEVAVAEGQVVPRDKVKIIQHLEGGIIKQIFVEEGMTIKAGVPLVELVLPVTGLNKEELQVQLDGLVLARARLSAEIENRPIDLPAPEAARNPKLAEAELSAFKARRQEHQSQLLTLKEQVQQRELSIMEIKAARSAIHTDMKMSRQHLKISADLVKDGLTSKIEHLERKREVKRLEGEYAALTPAIPRAEAALAEATEKLREAGLIYRRQILEEFRDAELNIARTTELLAAATQQDSRTLIKSPIDGVVKNLRYHTIGGVVRSGEPIMELVPSDNNLVIEARLSPTDRGYVATGQSARAKISTYDYIRYGALDGSIVQISADSSTGQNGEPYFRVVMQPERTYLGAGGEQLPIMPGMVATVDIKTGRKSILSYIIEPVLKIKEESFRERL